MDTKQPEALRLAELNENCALAWSDGSEPHQFRLNTAAELRRLNTENQALVTGHLADQLEIASLRSKLQTLEDLGAAGDDVQILRMGYAAARLEIASLQAQLEAVGAGGVSALVGASQGQPVGAAPVAWLRNLTDPRPHAVTSLSYRSAADSDAGVEYVPVYTTPQPAAQVQNAWNPIETAPKDKSNVVLLRQPCGSVANGFFLAEAYAGNGAWIWPYIHKNPTHWMPLPAPPAAIAAKQGAKP